MWRAGASEGRGGSSVKVSTKRGRSYLFVSYSRGGSHSFSRFFLWGWTSCPKTLVEFCQEGIGKASIIAFWIWNPPKWDIFPNATSWLVFLLIMCCLCGLGIWICQFLAMHWGALTIITKYSTASHKLHTFDTWTLSPINWLLANLYTHATDRDWECPTRRFVWYSYRTEIELNLAHAEPPWKVRNIMWYTLV